jgi:microcystin-dependent protein
MAENAALYPLYDVTDGGDDHGKFELPGLRGRALAYDKNANF